MRMSEDNIKNEPKTFNPESKSNRLQRLNHTEISISPWFDDDKNQHQESKNNCNMIPN